MKINANQLGAKLQSDLAPVYLISGDEQLLVIESANAIREAAKQAGYQERLVFHVEAGFDWNELQMEASAQSLFAQQRVIDLRLPSPKPGKSGSEVLREFAERTNSQDILIITTSKLDRGTQRAKWVTSLEKAGVHVQCWPVNASELPRWLDQRMRSRGLQPEGAAVRRLAERVEGNLLAAAQEVDKLQLLFGGGTISVDQIEQSVADNARFDVFTLVDAALAGDAAKARRMTVSLQREDAPLPVVAWALTKEVRLLSQLRTTMDRGGSLQNLWREAGVWESRKGLLQRAMRRMQAKQWGRLLVRCAELDRCVKGLGQQEPWDLVESIAINIASGQSPATA